MTEKAINWVNEKGEPVEVMCGFCKGPITTTVESSGKISRCEKDGVISKRQIVEKKKPNYSSAGDAALAERARAGGKQ